MLGDIISLKLGGFILNTQPNPDVTAAEIAGLRITRLMAEIGKFAEDGLTILIDNGWLEKPPQAADRKNIAKRKG